VRTAAEALKKPLGLDDVERWGSLDMERAQSDIFAPAPHQLDAASDQLGQPDATAQPVEKFRRVAHSAQLRSPGWVQRIGFQEIKRNCRAPAFHRSRQQS
jgi:hypothetical protein